MILTIGNSGVWEVEAFNTVKKELEKKGKTSVLFKQDKCLENEYLNFEIKEGNPKYTLDIDGETYNAKDFSAVWYLKPHLPRELLKFKPEKYRHYIHGQFNTMRQAIWSQLSNKKWIDDPWIIQKVENKIYQLSIASKYFLIPNTIITSDPAKVKKFYKSNNKKIIIKTLTSVPMIDKVLYTNRVTEEHFYDIDSLKMSPSIFQEEIYPKAYELRITIVGNQIFAVKINACGDEKIMLDWRKKPKLNDFEVKMEPIELPEEIRNKIFNFMEEIGLKYGCIDLVVKPNGEYIFFEINPNGQWYFIQVHTGSQIAIAIANLLI